MGFFRQTNSTVENKYLKCCFTFGQTNSCMKCLFPLVGFETPIVRLRQPSIIAFVNPYLSGASGYLVSANVFQRHSILQSLWTMFFCPGASRHFGWWCWAYNNIDCVIGGNEHALFSKPQRLVVLANGYSLFLLLLFSLRKMLYV